MTSVQAAAGSSIATVTDSPAGTSTCWYAFSSRSAQVTQVIRSLTYTWTVSGAGRGPELVTVTLARTVSAGSTERRRHARSEYSSVV